MKQYNYINIYRKNENNNDVKYGKCLIYLYHCSLQFLGN